MAKLITFLVVLAIAAVAAWMVAGPADNHSGHTGSTGLAGGDHLHFTMLLGGNAVTPIDWWSPRWIQDRVMRKLRDAAPRNTAQRLRSVPGRYASGSLNPS